MLFVKMQKSVFCEEFWLYLMLQKLSGFFFFFNVLVGGVFYC